MMAKSLNWYPINENQILASLVNNWRESSWWGWDDDENIPFFLVAGIYQNILHIDYIHSEVKQ